MVLKWIPRYPHLDLASAAAVPLILSRAYIIALVSSETMIFIQKLRSIAYTLKGERCILCRFYAVFMLFYTLLCANNDDFYAVFNSIIALTSYSKSSIPTAQV